MNWLKSLPTIFSSRGLKTWWLKNPFGTLYSKIYLELHALHITKYILNKTALYDEAKELHVGQEVTQSSLIRWFTHDISGFIIIKRIIYSLYRTDAISSISNKKNKNLKLEPCGTPELSTKSLVTYYQIVLYMFYPKVRLGKCARDPIYTDQQPYPPNTVV